MICIVRQKVLQSLNKLDYGISLIFHMVIAKIKLTSCEISFINMLSLRVLSFKKIKIILNS